MNKNKLHKISISKKIIITYILLLCFGLFNSFSQERLDVSLLNNYKYLVLKPKNKHNEFNNDIEIFLKEKFKLYGLPEPLDKSILYSEKGNNCNILTVIYSTENQATNKVELKTDLEFLNCNYEIVYKSSETKIYTFFNKKSILSSVENLIDKAFIGFSYKYVEKPIEKPVEKIYIQNDNNSNDFNQISPNVELIAENTNTNTNTNTNSNQPVYRGSHDPLKGLDVASAQQEFKLGNYYALIIGVDNYSGEWVKLNNAVNDAAAVEKTLKEKYVFNSFKTLYNNQATRKNIIDAFDWLMNNVNATDNVLIYFSGHGEFNQKLNKGFWVPFDANTKSISQYISNNDIQSFLGGIRSKHTLLVADACFSGDIFRGKTMSIAYEDNFKYYNKVHALSSRKAISSGGIEPVMDGGRDGHSVFAYYFLKALTENTKKYYDASEVYERIKISVVNNSEQTPNFNPIKDTGDEGGQFIFVSKTK